ncbi:U3 small nucleolar RNA-associated protein [Drechslerella dactyloides]|uniref:U3 small nucleolar RNA-associated protein n=1 Tax=Drechslerella dactyloides TaxID=74499 RepID=A0AAD6NI11_DREDA|nr:U3 small nucleolar RNA-associated protein [Drechslerella dactyloides]
MAGKSKKQKLSSNPRGSTKRSTAFASTSLSTASPILQSAFAPSWSKLPLFTSVLRGLDAQRLRCHDTATARLQCEHVFDKNVEITSLSWGSLAEPDKDAARKQKKKRKRASDANDASVADGDANDGVDGAQVVIAATSSNGRIFLYSPVQAEIVKTLEGGHVGPVTDFQFADSVKGVRAWSCGGNKLVEWDVKKGAPLRNIAFGETVNFYKTLPLPDSVVCASYSTYTVDITTPPTDLASTFSSHSSQVHTLRRTAKQNKFLSAADGDHFMYISDIKKEQSLGSLVAKGDVAKVDTTDSALVAVTADGVVELFVQPWSFQAASEDEDSSLKRKKAMTKTSEARIKVARPDSQLVKVVDACFQGDSVLIAWAENATSVLFETIKCLSADGGLTISGDVVITKAKTVGIGGAAGGRVDANGIKDVSNVNLKQANTVVIEGADMQDIGMVDAPEKPRSDEEDEENGEDAAAERGSGSEREENAEDDQEELTFEDRVKALTLTGDKSPRSNLSPSTNITVPSMEGAALITTGSKAVAFPNSTSLTTVLTQALKTDDRALLETCLQVTKADMIESTIQRLDSLLAASLVTKLAEIIARKPGRAGSLMVWIQKTLVNHGGHLLTLPDLVHTMASLQRVLGKRAEALPKMLALRGRLSMLVAQMKLRSMAKDRLGAGGDVAVVYVEGVSKDDESSSDEEAEEDANEVVDAEESDEEMSESEGANGVLDLASEGEEDPEDDEEESEEEEFGPGMYLDREAEETDDDSTGEDTDLDGFIVDDDEVDYDSQDDGSEEEEEAVAPKVVKKTRGRLVKGSMLKRCYSTSPGEDVSQARADDVVIEEQGDEVALDMISTVKESLNEGALLPQLPVEYDDGRPTIEHPADVPDELSYRDPVTIPKGKIHDYMPTVQVPESSQNPTAAMPAFCPGCGAKTHSLRENRHDPGYYGPEKQMPSPKQPPFDAKEDGKNRMMNKELDAVYQRTLAGLTPEVLEILREANMPDRLKPSESARRTPEERAAIVDTENEMWLAALDVETLQAAETAEALPERPFVLCSRCRNLAHHDKLLSRISDASFQYIAEVISQSPFTRIHIYHVIDAADFPLSLLPNARKNILHALRSFPGGNKKDVTMSYVITRADLLMPTEMQVSGLMTYFRRVLSEQLGPADASLKDLRVVSAKRIWTTERLKDEVRGRKGGVYLLGKTNVGKSRLFEAIFPKKGRATVLSSTKKFERDDSENPMAAGKESGEDDWYIQNGHKVRYPDMPLSHKAPGVTAGPIAIDFAAGRGQLVDLPGMERRGILDNVKKDYVSDTTMIRRKVPERFVLKTDQTLIVGGLVTVKLLQPEDPRRKPIVMEVAMFTDLPGHASKNIKLDGFLNKQVEKSRPFIWTKPGISEVMESAGVFTLKDDITAQRCETLIDRNPDFMKTTKFRIWATDILIEGCGWLEVSVQVPKDAPQPQIEVHSPHGKGIGQRETMKAYMQNLRPNTNPSPGSRPRKSMKGAKQAEKTELKSLQMKVRGVPSSPAGSSDAR